MSEYIHPAYECERCGCNSTQSVQTDDGDLRICARCDWVLGQDMSPHDKLVRELWRLSDEIGNPRPEDIHHVIASRQTPPDYYEIQEPSQMEEQNAFERDCRLALAALQMYRETNGQPETDSPPATGDTETGPDEGDPEGPEMDGWFGTDAFY